MWNLTRLRVLVAVAREGSVTGAAEALHYAQPSVSHHLARLEAEVGVVLVRRVGRGVVLTDAGRLLVERAEEILGRVESARAEVAAHAGLRTGRVRLAAFPSALATLVPPAAARLAAEHPGVELALTEAEPPAALTALRNADVDAALVFAHEAPPAGDQRNTTLTPLLEEPLYLVTGGASSEAAAPAHASPAVLRAHAGDSWIAGCERCRAHLVSACERAGFTPRITFETDDYVAVQALVAAGLGVSVLPGLALAAHHDPRVRAERLPGEVRRVSLAVYGAPAPDPVRAFTDVLRETVLPRGGWVG
ncbi:LysR family transcriptional regulator [Streptomyces sp. 3MP-14]|uniref:LysR family transcriptional regulator n=1 Tax=Streptomyces mimosae TaxID=2586635 RepID=A0A5N6AIM0_9ACTN|nr:MULTISPECIES: LysR family transcriptional regulator [Streptomyces]KAB8168524.1 LysR family transcriptional regulator [Streptomyces mimosae]KAB8178195.1 LysR family transcriptional regulator [Streptomyces sp. 3MP-14]